MKIDTDKIRREQLRWIMLLALGHARPDGCYEEVLVTTARDIYEDATAMEIRIALGYLEDRGLVLVRRMPAGRWWPKLTRYGIDIIEYTIDCEPGIARPAKYW